MLSARLRFFFFLALTFVFTTLAGAEWMTGNFWFDFGQTIPSLGWDDFLRGLQFSVPFIGILTIHEFGHYFFARKYKADVSLPFYIPAWLGFIGIQSIGTMGAFIRLRSQLKSRVEYFDVGVAGPLAGFWGAILLLAYGYTHLPSLDYLFKIHPDYARFGTDYADFVYENPGQNLFLGRSLLMQLFEKFAGNPVLIPNGYELMHYPYLFAGYLALFFTALNLMPIGQLDGGHILYATCGPKVHKIVSPLVFCVFCFYAGLGSPHPIDFQYDPWLITKLKENLFLFGMLLIAVSRVFTRLSSNLALAISIFGLQYVLKIFFPDFQGNPGWLVFALVLGRFLGIYHPDVSDPVRPGIGRILIAVFALIVFLLCFIPRPFN